MTTGRNLRLGEAVLGGGLLALGMLIAIQTMLTPSAGRGVVGPALFPYLVAGGLILVALSLLREAFIGHISHEGGFELDGKPVVIVAAGLVAQFLLIEPLGWIPTAALLFVALARAFGSRRILLDTVLGILLAGLTYVVFNYGLSLNLPSGTVVEGFAPAQ